MPSDTHRGSRLHPVSVLVGVPLVQIVRALVIPAFAVLAGGPGDRTPLLVLVILSVLLGLRVLAWQRFTWSFDGEVVRVEQGVLSRSRRVVDVERVQQVELDRPFVQRLLGVATLRIETAGSDAGPEVELRVLGLADALTLRAALQPRPAVGPPDGADRAEDDGAIAGAGTDAARGSADQPTVLLRLPAGRVALAAVTGAQLLLAPALLTGLLQLTGDRTEELIDAIVAWLGELQAGSAAPAARTWLLGAVAIVVVAVATTLTVSVVRDGGFVVLRRGDDLILRRGLLGTRESTVPLRRVQVVRVAANPLRRALGVASLRIHSAGGSAGGGAGGGGGDRRAVIPLVTHDELPDLLASLLPALDGLPTLLPHPPAARRRALLRRVRGLGSWLVPAIVVWVLMARDPDAVAASPLPIHDAMLALLARDGAAWTVPLLVASTLVLVQTLLAQLEHAALGHASDAHVVVARTGALSHVLSVAPLARLQGVTHRVSWFQARRDLATVRAHVAGPGGDVVVLDAAGDDARRLRSRLADAASGIGTFGVGTA